MKQAILILALLLPLSGHAYVSMSGNDVNLGYHDAEVKSVVKSTVATYSDAISAGSALFYEDDVATADTVSINYGGTYNTAIAARAYQACIATRAVPTGDLSTFGCVTKGYVDYALYNTETNNPIVAGDYLCISDLSTSKGRLVPCGTGIVSQFVALEAKSGSGGSGTMKVLVNSR